jgi:hypothetical protein
MPHYYFDVRNGRTHADSLGLDCRDDNGAIAKAKFIATQIGIDAPQLNHRHVAVLNDAGDEIFQVPIRITVSEPACAASIRLRSHPRPHAVVEHSKSRRPQLVPALGPLFWCRLKKIPARNELVFPMQRSWGLRFQSSGVAASCLVNRGQA